MEEFRNLYLQELQNRLGGIVSELTQCRYASVQIRKAWHPAINAYRCRDCILICADLAGVNPSQIDLSVEPRRVLLRGHRAPPEPRDPEGPPLQVLAMELDHGAFEREIVLPVDVAQDQVRAEHRDGLLLIYLPLALPA